MSMTHEELMAAVADPATRARIQWCLDNMWVTPLTIPLSSHFFNPKRWRLAPEPLPPGEISREEASRLWNDEVPIDYRFSAHDPWALVIPKKLAPLNDPVVWSKFWTFRRTPAPPPPRMVETLDRDMIVAEISNELNRAYEKHGRLPWGRHEFYAILREEVDELWDDIKSDSPQEKLTKEAIQVAAMVFRYLETGDRYRSKLCEKAKP